MAYTLAIDFVEAAPLVMTRVYAMISDADNMLGHKN